MSVGESRVIANILNKIQLKINYLYVFILPKIKNELNILGKAEFFKDRK